MLNPILEQQLTNLNALHRDIEAGQVQNFSDRLFDCFKPVEPFKAAEHAQD